MNEASVGAFAVTAVLGYAVVFIGLILLMIAIFVMGRVMKSRSARPAAHSAVPAAAPVPAVPAAPPAPGSAGELKLYDTDDKTAAMLMAIVADELNTPLNELRFKSIREVTSDEV
jgi:Na+-transporting methylmalonyl-CoA/oxaloacetate decarboxylase gamma subunit